jgi:hypothetical protein
MSSFGDIQTSLSPPNDASSNAYLNESNARLRESFVKQPSAQYIERNTLYDCIPVDKERRWAIQCRDVHAKVESNINELDELYGNITALVNSLDEPTIDFMRLNEINNELANCCQHQQRHMEEIRSNYQYVYGALTHQSSAAENKSEQHVTILSQLETIRIHQETILSSMLKLCEISLRLKNEVGQSKGNMTKCLFSRITLIAFIQTDAQKLLERLLQMKKWYKGRNEYFSHLEHVAHLPSAYKAFLHEIMRRRKYHSDLESKISTFTESLNLIRAEETSYRKEFMQRYGRNLPPVFFEMVPSLVEKPPYYNAEASNIPMLPLISDDDILSLQQQMQVTLQLSDGGKGEAQVPEVTSSSSAIATTADAVVAGGTKQTINYDELAAENQILKEKIAELTRELELSRQQVDQQAFALRQAADQTAATVTASADQNADVDAEEHYKRLVSVLSEGLMSIKSSLVGEILQKLSDIADPSESASFDDSLILGESQVDDAIKAKALIDRILNLIKQLKLTISRKFGKDVQVSYLSISILLILSWLARYLRQNLSFKIQTLEDELENKSRMTEIRSMDVSSTMKSSSSRSSAVDTDEIFISVTNFVENTIALFIYRNPTTYIAFNVHCPHRYLSQVT